MEGENKFTDAQIKEMEEFILVYYNERDVELETADEETRAKYKEYVEALCSIDNATGLRTKAYACYGKGNIVYPTDWKMSEACLLKLVELESDPWAANALGYIYYYGRTTDGVPDYERAFKYFSVAALYGLYEAIYKIADLCIKGEGVPMKCLRGAENIIGWLYQEVKPKFLSGNLDGQFADVASRMGRIYLAKAKEENTDTDEAHFYFLEALCALKLREPFNHYGDTSVLTGIRKGLAEARENTSFKDMPQDEKELLAVERLCRIIYNEDRFKVKVKKQGSKATVTIYKIGWDPEEPLFVVLPTIEYCKFIRKCEIEISGIKKYKKKNVGKSFIADHIYFYDGKLVIENFVDKRRYQIKAKSFKLKREELKQNDAKVYTMVSVEFTENGKLYDYIYDLGIAVSEGEQVVVPGYNGDTIVTVKKVYTASETELAIPIEKYKKVLRKKIVE